MAKKKEKKFEICPKCLGDGKLYTRGNHPSISYPRPCWKCLGTGEIEKEVKQKN